MKKTLAVILALVLVLSVLPVSVFAADNTVYTSSDGNWKYMVLDNGTASITTNSSTPAYLGTDIEVSIPLTIDGYRVSTIGLRAFQGSAVNRIYLPKSVTKIDSYAFNNCANLEYIQLNDGLLQIGYGAFLNSGIEYINIPNTVTLISTYAFKGCSELRQIKLSSSMTAVNAIFTDCTSLQSVYIYPSVTSINANAFAGCTSLNRFCGVSGSFAETYANNNSLTFRTYPLFTATPITVDTVYDVVCDPDIDNPALDRSREYFSFTPTVSGRYSFESYDSTEDPTCHLFDDIFELEMYSYGYYSGSDFYFEEYYEAGKTYYFDCHNSDTDWPSSFKVVLHQVDDVSSITLEETSITAYEGTTQYIEYELYPNISGCGIDFISSDATVVGVEQSGKMIFRKPGTATVTVRAENGVSATLSVTVKAIPTIAAGETKTVTFVNGYEEFIFKFVPTVSGYYNFYSVSDMDMYGNLYDSDYNYITSNDDANITFNPSNNYDFAIQYYMTAGETYFYRATNFGATGDAEIHLAAAPTSQWVNLSCDDTKFFEGVPSEAYINFDHESGAADSVASVVSSDTSVVTIGEINEQNACFLFNPVSAGTAVITFTSASGLTDTLSVTVTAAEGITENVTKDSVLHYYTNNEDFKVFKFTAAQTGTYSAILNVENDNSLEYAVFKNYDYVVSGENNESVAFDCTAGETLYLAVRLYNYIDNGEDVPFSVCVAPSATATAIKFDAGNSVTLTKECASQELQFSCSFEPWNAVVENYTITSSDDSVICAGSDSGFVLAGLGTATLTATSTNGLTATLTVNVTEPEEIHVNDTKTAEIKVRYTSVIYKFVPEQTAYYQFWSTENSTYGECDTYGYILDSGYNELASDDDGGDDLNFLTSYRLEAGETYYLKARRYSEGPGIFDVHLKKITDLDVSMDGSIDLNDVGFITSVSVGNINFESLSIDQIARCDRNADGIIDGFDAAKLDRELLEGEYTGPNAYVMYTNAVDNYGNRYSNGDTILLEPGEKMFIWFETDFARNASRGVTPFVGFTENDPHIATLSPEGFTITGGTGEDLGYTGIDSFGFEIDATGVPVGTSAPLYMQLYEFDGTFPGSGFDFSTANVLFEDCVYFEVVNSKS